MTYSCADAVEDLCNAAADICGDLPDRRDHHGNAIINRLRDLADDCPHRPGASALAAIADILEDLERHGDDPAEPPQSPGLNAAADTVTHDPDTTS